MLNKHKNGAWQEPENTIQKKANGAWETCEFARKEVDGAWEAVWENEVRYYYFRNGAFENGASISVGAKNGVYDTYEIGETLDITVNNGGNSTVKIYLPELLSYKGKTFVIEGEFTEDISVKIGYNSTNSNSTNVDVLRYKEATQASIAIPASTYTGANIPTLKVYGRTIGTPYIVKISSIYIIEE